MTENVQSEPSYRIDAPGLLRFYVIAGAVALTTFLGERKKLGEI